MRIVELGTQTPGLNAYVLLIEEKISARFPHLPERLVEAYALAGLRCESYLDSEELYKAWILWQNHVKLDFPLAFTGVHELTTEQYVQGIIDAVAEAKRLTASAK